MADGAERVAATHPSVATGLAALVGVAALTIAGRVVWGALAREAPAALPACCAVPVEVLDEDGSRLGCASDPELTACGRLQRGDRATLIEGRCQVRARGMAAPMRLLQGLKLDVNAVSASDLTLIDGVSPALARAIVEARAARGTFTSIEQLDEISGIGTQTLARLREVLEIP